MSEGGESRPDRGQRGASGLPARRFRIAPENLLDVLQPESEAEVLEPLEADDPYNALGRVVARVDAELEFATLYLTFEDGTYLMFAARFDEDDGIVLFDRFCEPAKTYDEYFILDDLAGESGPPPDKVRPAPGSGFDPAMWRDAIGRAVYDLGWDEEGMQGFVHFEDGAYLTLAARSGEGRAYLVGYFSPVEPPDGEYVVFEPDHDGEHAPE